MTNIVLTDTWVEISTTSCLFQRRFGNNVAISYGTAPSANETIIFVVDHEELIVLPAPTTGSIYARSANDEAVQLETASINVQDI